MLTARTAAVVATPEEKTPAVASETAAATTAVAITVAEVSVVEGAQGVPLVSKYKERTQQKMFSQKLLKSN